MSDQSDSAATVMAPEQEKATILVVDDTPENIDVLRGILRSEYKVKVAINGEQALKLCFSDSPPDLILLDIMMPGMDGYEVCRRLKESPRSEGIPVIFVTAMNETRDEVQGFEVGAVDYINKPITPAIVHARVRTHLKLRSAYRFIRDTFGRYLSEEIVDSLIDSPHGLKLGGEKRDVTVLMSDLRGFTSIGERLPAETVVDMINIYLGEMTEVIQKHMGTIDEFIGDAILAIFGAPIEREDDALRAVRCAVEMQQTMERVNGRYVELGYPALQMGIGINSGAAIVGNIGSKKRSKYAVVGRVVNTASRIESYTVGGQILISEETRDACAVEVRIDDELKVTPKGISEEMTIFDIGGVYGDEPLLLPEKVDEPLVEPAYPLDVQVCRLEGKFAREPFGGKILRLSHSVFEMQLEKESTPLTSLKVILPDGISELYVKTMPSRSDDPYRVHVRVSYMPEEAEAFVSRLLTEVGQ
ncbi:Adenylate cyclase, class 3 [Mariprofundus ferrinatatus]|uniref:Adenylate cyclase, class 3 n=1 Tax=Mariprofundus ferrinatatus TaxID=1921087 RepID=A0A2K8L5N8_9PROT|nr:adenylate/guanylate cyclase domain-containing protein [Mariprofundus ferrinatatus]ATX82422.1 Adenylate cyclase, class 3 [Mariprofundus ferrinatatus]